MRRSAALVVLAAALLAGCSSEAAEPEALPEVSTDVGTSASVAPSPTSAALPAEAVEATPEAASAFARHFYAEVQRGFATKDPDAVRRLSAPECETCNLFIASIARLRDYEETASPVVYNISYAETPAYAGDEAVVEVMYSSPAAVRKDKDGNVIVSEPESVDVQEQVVLTRASGGWLVKSLLAV